MGILDLHRCKLKQELVAMESPSGKAEKGEGIEISSISAGSAHAVGTAGGRVMGVHVDNFVVRDSINLLRAADPANVQQIAASQLELLAGHHQIALAQSRRSFFWAITGAGLGLLFFLCAAAFALLTSPAANAIIPLLSGAIVEAVAGVVFFLYGRTTDQLSSFINRKLH